MDERQLGRIEVQVDTISDDVKEIKELIREQNGRIRTLESRADKQDGGWKVAGMIGAAMGTIGGIAAKWLT